MYSLFLFIITTFQGQVHTTTREVEGFQTEAEALRVGAKLDQMMRERGPTYCTVAVAYEVFTKRESGERLL